MQSDQSAYRPWPHCIQGLLNLVSPHPYAALCCFLFDFVTAPERSQRRWSGSHDRHCSPLRAIFQRASSCMSSAISINRHVPCLTRDRSRKVAGRNETFSTGTTKRFSGSETADVNGRSPAWSQEILYYGTPAVCTMEPRQKQTTSEWLYVSLVRRNGQLWNNG
jgi:hypothetical protein